MLWVYLRKALDYKKIVITFLKTSLPHRFLKLTGLEFGEKIEWTERNLVEAHMREQLDLSGASVSINTLNLTVCAEDERFDIYNPQGVYEVLQERQGFEVQRFIDGVQVDSSAFYLNSWEEANENPATLEAYDLIGVLDTVDYKGDLYDGALAGTVIADIMKTAGVEYELDPALAEAEIYGWLQNGSCRDALCNILFAVGGLADCSRSDKVKIYPIDFSGFDLPDKMPMNRQAMEQKTKQYKAVTGVELTAHCYDIKSGTVVKEIYEEELEAGITEVVFSQPTYVYRVADGNAKIISSSANGMTLNVTQAGTVVVNGWQYEDKTQIVGHYATLKAGQKANVVTANADCTLISKHNAAAVAERLYTYYLNRYELNLDILHKQELLGQHLLFENRKAKQFIGFAYLTCTVDGKSSTGYSKTTIANGYKIVLTPPTLSDGSHTVVINCKDNDGNSAVQKSVTFTVDTVPPSLIVTSPADNLITNAAALLVAGITNDETSSPVTVKITVNSGSQTAASVNSDGSFGSTVTLAEGDNIVRVVATDAAGRSTTVEKAVVLDTSIPAITEALVTPNPVDAGATVIIAVVID